VTKVRVTKVSGTVISRAIVTSSPQKQFLTPFLQALVREEANMRYWEGVGGGLLLFGLMVHLKSGMAVGSEVFCFVLGLALVLLGAALMLVGRRKRR
jgi:hypothetical protein